MARIRNLPDLTDPVAKWAASSAELYRSLVDEKLVDETRFILKPTDFHLDTKQASDLITGICGPKTFAVRVRSPGYFRGRNFNSPTHFGLQFTVRSHRDSGVETELSKLRKGFGDLYFYGHVE